MHQLRPKAAEPSGLAQTAGNQRADSDRRRPHQQMDHGHDGFVHAFDDLNHEPAPFSHRRQDSAEHQGKNDQRQDVGVGHGREQVFRDEPGQDRPEQLGHAVGFVFQSFGHGGHVTDAGFSPSRCARLDQEDQDKPDDDRDARGRHEIQHRAASQGAESPYVPEAGDADDNGTHDQGNDQHEQGFEKQFPQERNGMPGFRPSSPEDRSGYNARQDGPQQRVWGFRFHGTFC